MEAVLFIGIQASGKSTFFKQRFFDTHVRINLDMLRTRHRETLLFDACLAAQQSFVVDNTNLTTEDRAHYIGPARSAGFRIVGYYFQSQIRLSLERNSQREGRARIPDKGVVAAHSRLQLPRLDEGFDLLYYVRADNRQFVVSEWEEA